MKRSDLGMLPSTFAAAVAEIGDAWTMLILAELVLGNRRFDGFIAQTGIAESSLAQRLKLMEKNGLIRRRAYQTKPVRYDYELTEKGEGIGPTLIMIAQWADTWFGKGGPQLHYDCSYCGEDPEPNLACIRCGTALTVTTAIPVLSDENLQLRTARYEAFQKKKAARNAG